MLAVVTSCAKRQRMELRHHFLVEFARPYNKYSTWRCTAQKYSEASTIWNTANVLEWNCPPDCSWGLIFPSPTWARGQSFECFLKCLTPAFFLNRTNAYVILQELAEIFLWSNWFSFDHYAHCEAFGWHSPESCQRTIFTSSRGKI